ncbi:MAG: hypothetical protein H6720_09460 [Sandaracinus sp.]|nr:hypothetical protein [Sandaracinus sp.]
MDDRPTLLMLGSGEPMRAALEEALVRYAALPEAADADSPVASVLAAAPDLVVLLGDAARAHATILPKLAANALTASVPVALLSPEGLDVRLSAARFGVALVPRTASADEMARQIAQLAREMPERPTQSGGAVGEGTLEELLDILRRELQGGILSVSQEGGRAARFVLRPGRNVEVAIRDFVKRIKPLVKESKPLHYELDDPGTGKLAVLDDDSDDGDRAILVGRRILLVEDDAATADALAQELRGQGAIVAVATSQGGGLDRARALDPEVVLVDEAALDGEGFAVLRTIRRDLSLRWASILVARLRDLLPAETAPRMDRLAGSLAPLLAPDREIAELAKKNERFEARLETCGPSRLLRALAASGNTFHVTARHPRVVVELDVAEGLVAGADATPMGDAARRASGTAAVAALLAVGSARVTVEPREAPTSANLLMPVGDLFMAAAKESPPIRPSLPPLASSQAPPAGSLPPPALLGELRRVLDQLKEQGLADLTGEHDLAAVEAAVEGVARPAGPRRKATLVGMPAPSLPESSAPPSGPPLPPLSDVPTSSMAVATPRMPAPRVPAPVPTPAAVTAKVPRAVPKVAVPRVAVPKVAGAAKAAKPSVPPPAPGPALARAKSVPPPTPATAKSVPPPTPATAKSVPPPTPATAKSVPPPAPSSPALAKSVPPPAPAIARAKSVPPPSPSTPPAPPPAAADWASAPPPPHLSEPSVTAAMVAPSFATPSAPEPATSNTATESLDAFDLDAAMAEPMGTTTPLQPTPTPSAFADLDDEPLLAKPNRTWIYVVAGAVVLASVVVGGVLAFGGDDSEVATHASPPAAGETQLTGQAPVEPAPEATPTEATPTEATPTEATPTEATPTETIEPEATPEEPEATPEEPDAPSGEGDADEDEGDEGDEDTPAGSRDRLRELVSTGNFFRGRAQWDRARRAYEGALRIAPRNGPALAGLAKIALAQRRAPEAVRHARTLVQVNARTAGNHVLLGDALSAAGDRSGARAAWEQALRINPRHRTARARLGR